MSMTDETEQTTAHTPEPWKAFGTKINYLFDSGLTETIADVRGARFGEDDTAHANARRICAAVNACEGISTGALEQGTVSKLLAALIDLIEQLEGIGISDWRGAEGLCLKQARAVIAEATGNLSSESRKPIVIKVRGGVVQEVRNVPPGYQYEVKDYDSLEADEEAAGRQQSPLDKWLEKWDMPQDSGMSEPTNRDRARWAGDALAVFTDATFSGDHPDTMHRDDLECAIGDLICDLLHLAHQKGFDPQAILEQGSAHFKSELFVED